MSLDQDIEDKAQQEVQGATRQGQRGQEKPDIQGVTRQKHETELEMDSAWCFSVKTDVLT